MKHNLETLKKNFTREELAEIEKELREMREDYKKHGIGDPVVDMLFKAILSA